MHNTETNTIMFPHVIPGGMLGGKKHTWNNVNGGIKNLTDFNLIRNKFLGGNVEKLGFIKEYGFFACPHYENWNLIVGFYIHDPALVTDLGHQLLKAQYPGVNIIYDTISVSPHTVPTPQEIARKAALLEEAMNYGASAPEVDFATVEELDGLIKAHKSGPGLRVVTEDTNIGTDKVAGIVHLPPQPTRKRG